MSLHTRCPQRIASTSRHHTVWRRQSARYYASSTAVDPEWFQTLRSEMLSRKPSRYRENLDPLHNRQLRATLKGFQADHRPGSESAAVLSDVLTRFNTRVPSSMLLADGTDVLHSPGEPWQRRMWAGGAVTINPNMKTRLEAPFQLRKNVVCLERIKDVRLHGTGTDAKIFVTIERCFNPDIRAQNTVKRRLGEPLPADTSPRVSSDDGWSGAMLKEERSLVFLKTNTALTDQTLEPRYLKSPSDPEYSFSLTPTRDLLFRYSALTFNAHLIHLDPTYARTIEGHRNLLVHGQLTLTLMLRALYEHITPSAGEKLEQVASLEYRNLAPLYCDEQMRVCVKKRKGSETVNTWDIWIEGPTGGMAVKAVARTTQRDLPKDKLKNTRSGKKMPEVDTVAAQARSKLNALNQKNASTQQLADVSRANRRLSQQQQHKQSAKGAQKAKAAFALSYLYSKSSPLVVRVVKPLSRSKRRKLLKKEQQQMILKDCASAPLSYLYTAKSPLLTGRAIRTSQRQRRKLRKQMRQWLANIARNHRAGAPLSEVYAKPSPLGDRASKLYATPPVQYPARYPADDPTGLEAPIVAMKGGYTQTFRPYSRNWRNWRVGKALPYLYLGARSALLRAVGVPRQARAAAAVEEVDSATAAVAETSPSAPPAAQDNTPTSSPAALEAASSPPSKPLSQAQKQRAMLLAGAVGQPNTPAPFDSSTEEVAKMDGEDDQQVPIRKLETRVLDDGDEKPVARVAKEKRKYVRIKKMESVSVRKVDIRLQEAARKRGHGKSKGEKEE